MASTAASTASARTPPPPRSCRSRADDPTDAAALLGELRARGAVTVPAGGTATGAAQLVLDVAGRRAVLVVDGLAAVDA